MTKIPAIWQREIDAGTAFGQKAAAALAKAAARPTVHGVVRKYHSGIGDRLKRIIQRETTAGVPCQACRAEIARLNSMTPTQVRDELDALTWRIVLRARTEADAWYARLAARWAADFVEGYVREWVLEAIGDSAACSAATFLTADNPPLQFVWCYWAGGAKGDELRWSMRSVVQHYGQQARLMIVGDRPPWYSGPCILQPRIPETANHEYRDMLSKMHTIAHHPDIEQQLCWMMDDVYLVTPAAFTELATPRAARWTAGGWNRWQRRKTKTMQRLEAEGLTQYDYATHAPHVVQKHQLAELWPRYQLDQNTYLWEVLWGNTFCKRPESPFPFLRVLSSRGQAEWFAKQALGAVVVNHQDNVWCPQLRRWLMSLLPTPTQYEVDHESRDRILRRRAANQSQYSRLEGTAMTRCYMLIQSAYSDPDLSARRLEIARHTCIPSLASQTLKPVLHVAMHEQDPLWQDRVNAFLSTGCEVRILLRKSWRLYRENWEIPDGRRIVSRMDDDDVIPFDFCSRTAAAAPESGDHLLLWPVGYVWWRETAYRLRHNGNQFVTLVTDRNTDPHQENHWEYHKRWSTVVVSQEPGWMWVRHGDAATSTLHRYRRHPLRGIDAGRFRINLRAIVRAIAASGQASGDYAEHGNSETLKYVLQENEKHAP